MNKIILAHSELTNTIYAIVGREKIDITEQAIAEVKAIQALNQEPKTGHWIIHDKHRECSVCNVWLPKDMPRNSYCPNCGCKMSETPTGSEICDNDCEHCDWVTCPKEEGEDT